MGSVLDDLRREQFAEHAALTPATRLRLGERLGEEALALLMSAQGLDRESAIRLTTATRRTGRRRCRCLDEGS
jgi:hypothetical protein